MSQETLAEMVGTTRSRVNFFMNKFRNLGFIEDNGGLKINNSLLSVVLRDRSRAITLTEESSVAGAPAERLTATALETPSGSRSSTSLRIRGSARTSAR